jgi:hypothetical protein
MVELEKVGTTEQIKGICGGGDSRKTFAFFNALY